jgi:hypothetical protein
MNGLILVVAVIYARRGRWVFEEVVRPALGAVIVIGAACSGPLPAERCEWSPVSLPHRSAMFINQLLHPARGRYPVDRYLEARLTGTRNPDAADAAEALQKRLFQLDVSDVLMPDLGRDLRKDPLSQRRPFVGNNQRCALVPDPPPDQEEQAKTVDDDQSDEDEKQDRTTAEHRRESSVKHLLRHDWPSLPGFAGRKTRTDTSVSLRLVDRWLQIFTNDTASREVQRTPLARKASLGLSKEGTAVFWRGRAECALMFCRPPPACGAPTSCCFCSVVP